MTLKPNWREIFKKAWSIRLGVLAGLFSGAEVVLPLFVDSLPRNEMGKIERRLLPGIAKAKLT